MIAYENVTASYSMRHVLTESGYRCPETKLITDRVWSSESRNGILNSCPHCAEEPAAVKRERRLEEIAARLQEPQMSYEEAELAELQEEPSS